MSKYFCIISGTLVIVSSFFLTDFDLGHGLLLASYAFMLGAYILRDTVE